MGLARAIDLTIAEAIIAPVSQIRPATYLGKGKVEEIVGLITGHAIELVVMDCALSPIQQRNLEKAWNTKVLDRTGLILEIFGASLETSHQGFAHLARELGITPGDLVNDQAGQRPARGLIARAMPWLLGHNRRRV